MGIGRTDRHVIALLPSGSLQYAYVRVRRAGNIDPFEPRRSPPVGQHSSGATSPSRTLRYACARLRFLQVADCRPLQMLRHTSASSLLWTRPTGDNSLSSAAPWSVPWALFATAAPRLRAAFDTLAHPNRLHPSRDSRRFKLPPVSHPRTFTSARRFMCSLSFEVDLRAALLLPDFRSNTLSPPVAGYTFPLLYPIVLTQRRPCLSAPD
ncbi:hypothetical protein B0H15DRAFT_1027798 [Mycena belliarum]|uniref:Uncharacterized protein n=1 Tax=Mycena belliarum TaxID=1033014 RepID=A0AAD6TLP9_9AGAR|nr:hypothetical protein B0H15DRAFT_1027798 [Mycena belliae]